MQNDLLEINGHSLLNGDSTQGESYKLIMGDKKATLLLADPPFCILTRRGKKGKLRDPKKVKNEHEAVKRYESVREYRIFTEAWMKHACNYIEDDGTLAIWTNFLGKDPIKQTAEKLGWNQLLGEFQWAKLTKESAGNEVMARIYEVALIFSKNPPKEKSNDDKPECWSVVTHYDEEGEANDWGSHPNHKPYSSLEPLIRSYTAPGNIILDPFNGSGSTPACVVKLDRVIKGIELKSQWAKTTKKRVQSLL